jgi:hypothetical protein
MLLILIVNFNKTDKISLKNLIIFLKN